MQGDEPFIEDPRDLEAFIAQIQGERKTSWNITVTKARYDKEEYTCIYLDFKEAVKQK